ncbi:MAG: MFS transporter [Alphaproteobacteria bacterium]|jgi:MFS family permease|nr:MFS transporter [Alphaproteobacteria bacterium]MDP6256058.1 MFS transporter [Alphaproteobacteria bacterium]MDP7054286.1 MFS transporter [Alphaproteobacteria bacterium]MDP7230583.1 MFS transporter [Alphaproteobacteria bacterium]HJM90985.1 MFS transporter [Alphaproteobacteria bacterium]|tara:strand:+ start:2943 stop:4142 length:1200 start_codon:yes stop_codon:yes gene_type:complete
MINIPAFAIADYRKLWAGSAFNQQGMSGEQVVLGLLVFQFTQSTAWVGVMLAVYFLPFFVFGIVSGAVADRLDRRALLRRVEALIIINMVVFAAVLALDLAALWVIIVFTLITGGLRALHQPARLSYAYDIIGGDKIVSGLGLLNLGSRTGQLIGALAAGAVMARYGGAAAFLVLASGHGLAFIFFLRLRTVGKAAVTDRVPLRQNIREYVVELRANHLLLMLVAVTAAVEIFGFSFATALPELASTRLNLGADGLGMLHAARAVGGMIAGLGLTFMGALQRRGLAYLGVIFSFGASLMLLSADSPLLATLVVVALVAGAAAASDILTQSMMQMVVPNALRGRAMGVWVLAIGFGPLGHLEMGGLAEMLGLGPALFTNGAALLAVGVIVNIVAPRLRQL